jgi:hypothetical protein
MSRTTEESLSYELFSARILPTVLLIVIPFGMGIILPYLSPIFHFSSSILQPTIAANIILRVDYLTRYIPMIPVILFSNFIMDMQRKTLTCFLKKEDVMKL